MFKKNINKNLKFSIYLVVTIIITLGFSISIQSLLAAWTTPTASPPSGNVSGLLNEGINDQAKSGGLTIGGVFKVDSADNTLVVDATNNSVGIGIDNPNEKLEIKNIGVNPTRLRITDTVNNPELQLQYGSGNDHWSMYADQANEEFHIWGHAENRLSILSNGTVGIGEASPDNSFKLHVNGDVKANAFFYSSDRRLKKDIKPISNALDKILQLSGIFFKWKDADNDKKTNLGLIAQDVEKIFPELVSTNENTGLKSVQYGNLVAPLIEAIKEQQAQAEEQQKQINELKEEVNKLKD